MRSGDASATEYFELGAVMLRRKFYPAATKYLLQAIEKWDGDDQDLAQVCLFLFVVYIYNCKRGHMLLFGDHLYFNLTSLCRKLRNLVKGSLMGGMICELLILAVARLSFFHVLLLSV